MTKEPKKHPPWPVLVVFVCCYGFLILPFLAIFLSIAISIMSWGYGWPGVRLVITIFLGPLALWTTSYYLWHGARAARYVFQYIIVVNLVFSLEGWHYYGPSFDTVLYGGLLVISVLGLNNRWAREYFEYNQA